MIARRAATLAAIALATAIASCAAQPVAPLVASSDPIAPSASAPLAATTPPSDARTVDATSSLFPEARNLLFVSMAPVRRHPLADKIRAYLAAASPWLELGDSFDPLRDTDWLVFAGSSFKPPQQRSAFLLRFAANEHAMDVAVDALATRTKEGAPVDTGNATVKGSYVTVHGHRHALLRMQTGLLAIVPPDDVWAVTRTLAGAKIEVHFAQDEAMRARVRRPYLWVPSIPPESVYELRASLFLYATGGATLHLEADAAHASEAIVVANELKRELARRNTPTMKALSGDLLGHVVITTQGAMVEAKLDATQDQMELVIKSAFAVLGIDPR